MPKSSGGPPHGLGNKLDGADGIASDLSERTSEVEMKAFTASFVALILGCLIAQAADDKLVKQVVKQKVEEINEAVIREDFGKVLDLTHPKVVEEMGGREKAITQLQAGM